MRAGARGGRSAAQRLSSAALLAISTVPAMQAIREHSRNFRNVIKRPLERVVRRLAVFSNRSGSCHERGALRSPDVGVDACAQHHHCHAPAQRGRAPPLPERLPLT